MSKLAEQLKTVFEPDIELFVLGCNALQEAGKEDAPRTLRAWLLPRPDLFEALARYYIETRIVPDMQGEVLSSTREGHSVNADAQKGRASSCGPLESGGANGHAPPGHQPGAPPLSPLPGGRGLRSVAEGRTPHASPVRKPNPPRGLEAIALAQRPQDRELFDTFKVRGGISIGDLTVAQAQTIAATNETEARILRTLCKHVAGYVPGGTKLRDAIKPSVLKKALAQNVEVSDVA